MTSLAQEIAERLAKQGIEIPDKPRERSTFLSRIYRLRGQGVLCTEHVLCEHNDEFRCVAGDSECCFEQHVEK